LQSFLAQRKFQDFVAAEIHFEEPACKVALQRANVVEIKGWISARMHFNSPGCESE
jgi:hypothetical protein